MTRATRSAAKIDETLLLRILREEENDASLFHESEIAREQADAMDRYHARPYGDELPGRSRIVTHDIEDAINWALPHLTRHFAEADDLIAVVDDSIDDGDQSLDDAANYLRHVLFKDNPGQDIIHDFLFDGLLQKIGIARSYWEPDEPQAPKQLDGITVDQVMRYANDPRYAIIAAAIDGEIEADTPQTPPQQMLPPSQGQPLHQQQAPQPLMLAASQASEPTFSLLVQKRQSGKLCIECIPPEEFRISRRAKSLKDAGYVAWRTTAYVQDLMRDHPAHAYELDPDGSMGDGIEDVDFDRLSDARTLARFPTEGDTGRSGNYGDDVERKKVAVHIEYIRGDFDRDKVVELRRIKRCGSVILENDIVDDSEFSIWSPIRVSHRAIGRAMADTIIDIQKVRTVLTRKAMDSVAQALAPRMAVDMTGAPDGLLEKLIDQDIGDVLPMQGDVTRKIMPLMTPDVSASAAQWIEYWDRRSEEASGVNRHAMGIQPQAITDTKGGIENLQAAANARIEQYARAAAYGLQDLLNKALRLIVKHQDQARIIKVNGRRLKIDPSRWSDEMTVSVHVGMVGESREKRLAYLTAIAAKQELILQTAGPGNPLATLKNYSHTLRMMVQAMGYRNASEFFADIPDNWQPPAPGPDPKTMEMQQKAQLAQADMQQRGQIEMQKAQAQAQLAQAEAQHKTQLETAQFQRDSQLQQAQLDADKERQAAEFTHKTRLAEMQTEADARQSAQKAANEMEIARMRIAEETSVARERMAAEMELARWETLQKIKLDRMAIRMKPKAFNGNDIGSDTSRSVGSVRMGGQIG